MHPSFLWADVSKPEEVNKLFQFAVEKMDGIDVFFANAGFAYYEKLGASIGGRRKYFFYQRGFTHLFVDKNDRA